MHAAKCPHCHVRLGQFMYADACPHCHKELHDNTQPLTVSAKRDPLKTRAWPITAFFRMVAVIES